MCSSQPTTYTEANATYALADVTHLAKLFPMLRERLVKGGRMAWVEEEMLALTDPALYDVDPENAWKRLKPRKHTAKYLAVFKAVAAWRERTAQQRDQPRGRILKDDAIDELAAQAPTDAAAIDRLRGVPKGFSGKFVWPLSGSLLTRYGPVGKGQIEGALVVRGDRDRLAWPMLARGVLLLAAPDFLCAGKGGRA